jgi:hypothetical protein
VLDRHGLVERRGRERRRAQGTPLSLGQRPPELCTDYKGEFLLGNSVLIAHVPGFLEGLIDDLFQSGWQIGIEAQSL